MAAATTIILFSEIPGWWWIHSNFAPLSDMDETEMKRDYERSQIAVGIQKIRNNKIKSVQFVSRQSIGKSDFFKKIKHA